MPKIFRPFAIALLCAAAPQKEGPAQPVNINTATRTELIQVPRIGEKMADQIVEFRKANGPFKRVEEIMNVKGMGEKTFLSIKRHLTVGSGKQAPAAGVRGAPRDRHRGF